MFITLFLRLCSSLSGTAALTTSSRTLTMANPANQTHSEHDSDPEQEKECREDVGRFECIFSVQMHREWDRQEIFGL